MHTQQLNKLHNERPFQPLCMHLADGRHFDVDQPEFLAYAPQARVAILMRVDGSFEIVDLMLATMPGFTSGKRNRPAKGE